MKRRILSLALAFCLCAGLLSTVALAEDSDFEIEDGILIYYDGPAGDVVIPAGVTRIAEGAFSFNSNIKSVTLPNGITEIGEMAFDGCDGLTNVTIPNSVIVIKKGAFYGCTALERITIPNGVTYIGPHAFYGCSSLKKATIPASIQYIDDAAFYDCLALSTVILPDSVVFSGNAFYGCDLLPGKFHPDGISVTESDRTPNGFWITSDGRLYRYDGPGGAVTVPDNVVSIEYHTFNGCDDIESIMIPDSVVVIDRSAFVGCSGLRSLTIPDSVVAIGHSSFAGCSNLERVEIGSGLAFLSGDIFRGVTSKDIVFNSETEGFVTSEKTYEGCNSVKHMVFPEPDKCVASLKYIDLNDILGNFPDLEEIENCPDLTINDRLVDNQAIISAWSMVAPSVCITPQSERIVALSKEICSGLISDYDKAKAVFDWITANIEYDYDYYTGRKQTVTYYPDEVLDSKLTICGGYSRLTQALLQAQNIPTLYVSGLATGGITNEGNEHAWNLAFVEGQWIYIDSTWGRPLTFDTSEGGPSYSYDSNWFNPTPLYVALSHVGKASYIDPNAPHYTGDDDTPSSTTAVAAAPNRSTVLVNGQAVAFDAYTINQNNYFKLRDLGKILSGTGKQFEVTWDGTNNAIGLIPGKPYTAVGGELAAGDGTNKTATLNASVIYLDGEPIQLTAYTIKGNNYFKLRDIGATFDFVVDWDGAKNTIIIDTTKSYTPD